MSNEEKQIEEIANILYESDNKRNVVICGIEQVAEDIYNADYRKASDVAREIFADIKNIWEQGRGFIKYTDLVDLERIYENKYESEGGE